MPINGMNVGGDYSITYYDGTLGTLIDLGDVQDVKISAAKHDIKSMPYNNDPRFGYVADGFKIDFTITRTGSVLEDLMITINSNQKNGVVQQPGYLNRSVINPDGTTSRYQYTGFVIFLTDPGNIDRDKVSTMKLEGMAGNFQKIA